MSKERLTETINVRITENEKKLMNIVIETWYPRLKTGAYIRMVLHLHWRKLAEMQDNDKLDSAIQEFLKIK